MEVERKVRAQHRESKYLTNVFGFRNEGSGEGGY